MPRVDKKHGATPPQPKEHQEKRKTKTERSERSAPPHVKSDEYEPQPKRTRRSQESDTRSKPPAVYKDDEGRTFRPSRSKVVDVHESRSGKSVIVEHKDGISEIRDKKTGKVKFEKTADLHHDTPPPPPVTKPTHTGKPGTYTTPGGTVVHRDRDGHVTYPNRSKITDVHDSKSGKSWVVERHDGVREIHNKETGKVTYAKRPAGEVEHRYIAPPSARTATYRRHDVTNITYNETNIYLRGGNYYHREPVFYVGYRWEPPLFAPLLFTAAVALLAIDAVYRPDYPRDAVTNMTGVNWYGAELHRAGIYNSYDLVRQGRTPEDREVLADITGMPYSEVRKAVGQADLMRVNGIGPHNSRLLVDAGIDSVQDLARYTWDPVALYEQLKYSSFWDGQRAPTLGQVESWISQARYLPVAIYDDSR